VLTIDLGCGQIGARNHRRSLFRTEAGADDPISLRALIGSFVDNIRIYVTLAAIACGCAVMAAGMWHFRADLNLAAMPGAAQLAAAARRRHKKRLGREARLATRVQPGCTSQKTLPR